MQFQSTPVASRPAPDAHLAPFVRADLAFDIPAIRREAKARYAEKLGFISRYTGAARRYWQIAIARRLIRETWADAHQQRHHIVLARMPAALRYTGIARKQLTELTARMSTAPVTAQGNADFKAAAGQVGRISNAAQRRAYLAVLAEAGRFTC